MALGSDLPSSELGIIRELSERPQWVCWKAVTTEQGKVRKMPISPITGRNAKVNNPMHWGTFEEARAYALSTDVNGVGFVLTGLEGYTVIDLDHVVNPDTGEISEPWAVDVVKAFNTYTELSPSLTGLHLWSRGKPPGDRCRTKSVEMYALKRYVTLTGKMVELAETDEIEARQEQIEELYDDAFNTTPVHGDPPKIEKREPVADKHGYPLPSHSQWTFEEANFYCQKVFQDGRPNLPADKLLALNQNDRKFGRIWRKVDAAATKACEDDQSRWDLAIANRLFLADMDLTWHEMIALLISFREKYDADQTKLMRADYWARTIARASDHVSKRREAKDVREKNERDIVTLSQIEQKFEEAVEDKNTNVQREAIGDLCSSLGIPDIMKITRANRKNHPLFTIHFGDEESGQIEGDVTLLTSQSKFRNTIAAKILSYIKPMSPKKWGHVTTLLLASVIEEDALLDVGAQAQMIELFQGYLALQSRPPEFNSDTYLLDGPWWFQGKLVIKISSFETYLKRYHKMAIDRMELARRLRGIGVKLERRSYRIDGRVTSMSAYIAPDENNFHALANSKPQLIEICDEEEEEVKAQPDPGAAS